MVLLSKSFTTVSSNNNLIPSEESISSRMPNTHVRVQTPKHHRFHTFPLVQAPQKRIQTRLVKAAVSPFLHNIILFGRLKFRDNFGTFSAFYGVIPPFSGNLHILRIMRIITVDNRHTILTSRFHQPLKIRNHTLRPFSFQFPRDKIIKHINNYNRFILQKRHLQKLKAQTRYLTFSTPVPNHLPTS